MSPLVVGFVLGCVTAALPSFLLGTRYRGFFDRPSLCEKRAHEAGTVTHAAYLDLQQRLAACEERMPLNISTYEAGAVSHITSIPNPGAVELKQQFARFAGKLSQAACFKLSTSESCPLRWCEWTGSACQAMTTWSCAAVQKTDPAACSSALSRDQCPSPLCEWNGTSCQDWEYNKTLGFCRGGQTWNFGTFVPWDCSPGLKDFNGCKAACDANQACIAFDRPQTAAGVLGECCIFKGGTGNGEAARDCFVKKVSKANFHPCNECGACFEEQCSYSGHEIRTYAYLKDESVCQQFCQITEGCQYWSFLRRGRSGFVNSECILMSALSSRRPGDAGTVSGPRSCPNVPRSVSPALFSVQASCSLYGTLGATLTERSKQFLKTAGSVGALLERLRPVLLPGIEADLRQFLTSTKDFSVAIDTMCSDALNAPPAPWYEDKWIKSCRGSHGAWEPKWEAEALVPHALIRSPWLHSASNRAANLTLQVLWGLCFNHELQYPLCMGLLKQNEAFRRNPKRHYLLLMSDRGRCSNGYDKPVYDMGILPTITLNGEVNTPCFDQAVDVVMPGSLFSPSGLAGVQLLNAAMTAAEQDRPRLGVMFLGGHYPMRITLAEMFENDTDIHVDKQYRGYEEVLRVMLTGKFCLMADGNTPWSTRLVEYIALACVPVLVSDKLVPPFHRTLDWSKMSVKMSEKDARESGLLKVRLQQLVQNGEYAMLRNNLLQAREAMLYHPGDWLRGNFPLLMYELMKASQVMS